MGIVDGTPVRHLRPVANSYGMEAAIAEGRALLTRYEVKKPRSELWKNRIIVPTDAGSIYRARGPRCLNGSRD